MIICQYTREPFGDIAQLKNRCHQFFQSGSILKNFTIQNKKSWRICASFFVNTDMN
jgi:hypothetical protein